MKLIVIFFFLFDILAPALAQSDSAMIKSNHPLDEVVVTGTRNETDIRYLPMSITVVTNEQITQKHEQSLLPILNEQVPGLFSTSRGVMGYGVANGAAGAMSVRGIGGSPTTRMLVLIDGHPQYMGVMGHPMADAYQSMMAEKVEVIRGPASVLYGSNAMGGVINIVTRQHSPDSIETSLNLSGGSFNTFTGDLFQRYSNQRFSSLVAASYNRTDGHRANMNFDQWNGYLKLGYTFSTAWSLSSDANITRFNASNPGTKATPIIDNDSRITRGMTSLSIDNNYNNTSGAFKFYFNWGHHQINDGFIQGNLPPDYRYRSNDQMAGITWYQSATLLAGNRITVGVDYQYFGGHAWNLFPDKEINLANKSADEVAVYVDVRQSLGSRLTMNAGVRADHHSLSGMEWIPQTGLSLHLSRSVEVKTMIGKGFRNPTIRELYMFASQNPLLRPERLVNYEVSLTQNLMDNALTYAVNVFYIKGNNIIQTQLTDGRPMNVNTGAIENRGIEAVVDYRINRSWKASANYSYLKMKHLVVAAPEHKLYADVNYSRPKWNISSGVQYVSGLYTSVNPETKEDFVLWNLRASCRIDKRATLFVRGENLLSQTYQINAGFPMPGALIVGGINIKL